MDIRAELAEKAEKIGITVNEVQAECFQTYLELLLEWNEKMNLTAITDPHEAVVKHFVDSLTFLQAVEPKNGAKIIDVGTGAGFPGIPVKIMRPDVELTLLDGLNKRLLFLEAVTDTLGIKSELVHKRAEEAGRLPEMRERYDIATARAVASLSTLCEYCVPLVKKNGVFAAMKGPGLETELKAAEKAMGLLGCVFEKSEQYILPDDEKSERNIAVFRKTRSTPKEYPRHGNKIKSMPL